MKFSYKIVMLYGTHFKSYKESRVFAALYICNALSYTAVSVCKITSYLVLKVNIYRTQCTVHTNIVLHFDTSYISSAHILYGIVRLIHEVL